MIRLQRYALNRHFLWVPYTKRCLFTETAEHQSLSLSHTAYYFLTYKQKERDFLLTFMAPAVGLFLLKQSKEFRES